MPGLFYRLSSIIDPEERLEDACMAKAMHDHYGDGITLLPPESRAPDEGVTFGRTRRFEMPGSVHFASNAAYWEDPGFAWSVKRRFAACDLQQASDMVAELHAEGKDAFFKSREQKLMNASVMRGETFSEIMGDMAFSFMDLPGSLLVQEHVEMTNERRFVVIDGKVVTCSPVQVDLTPMSRAILFEDTGQSVENLHFRTPTTKVHHTDHTLAAEMREHVDEVASRAGTKHMIVDVATIGDRIEVIEYNPMLPGMFGLFACRPDLIARASEGLLPTDLLDEVLDRRARRSPFPAPDAAVREPDPETAWEDDEEFPDGP